VALGVSKIFLAYMYSPSGWIEIGVGGVSDVRIDQPDILMSIDDGPFHSIMGEYEQRGTITLEVDMSKVRYVVSEDKDEDEGDESMKDLLSVTVWSVEEQKLVCYDEPYVGSEGNARTVFAMKYKIDPERIEEYDFLIAGRGRVREKED
jgi:hypothetical protein